MRHAPLPVLFLTLSLSASGYGVAQPPTSGHQRMLEELAKLPARVAKDHFYLGEKDAPELRRALEAIGPETPAWRRWELRLRLGEEEQRLGRELVAIEHFSEALRLLPEVEADLANEWIVRLYFRLGVAHLRYAETKNCAEGHVAEACILPVRGRGIHRDPEPARRALGFFEKTLERADPGSDAYLSSVWLLNIAFMTVGGYPGEVPPEYLIPPESLASKAEFPRFENIAGPVGVATFSLSGGVIVEDFDGNGHLDLLVSTNAPDGPVRLFSNDGSGAFVERTEQANLAGLFGGLNMVQADFDNDSDIDVYILRGAWLGQGGEHPNSLLRNNGDGTFTDVTFELGLGERHFPTQTAAWADYDLDGDLDLYVGNETHDGLSAPCQLFENRDGFFVDVAERAGVTNDRFTKAVVWGDYDNDGDPDLFVSNLDDANRLYRNDAGKTFSDVASDLGVVEPRISFPAWFWDFNNDGRLDLFVSAYEAIIMDLAAHYLGQGYHKELPRLYRGRSDGGFDEVSAELGLTAPSAPMGANFGDLNSDGYPDFYLGTGYPPYFALMPNLMYWNRDGKGFTDVTTAGGFGHLQKGHGVAFADLDGDGDQDVFEQLGGALAGDRSSDALFENPGFGHRWLKVRLWGVDSSRSAIGARIRLEVRTVRGKVRAIYKHVNSGGSFGANPLTQHIGLGDAAAILGGEILWPSGTIQRLEAIPLDVSLELKEGWARPHVRDRIFPSFSEVLSLNDASHRGYGARTR